MSGEGDEELTRKNGPAYRRPDSHRVRDSVLPARLLNPPLAQAALSPGERFQLTMTVLTPG
jgi:hypothetical protein